MRYILNAEGFIETISFNYEIECNNKTCIEYTGTVPTGYETLAEWNENANINAYKIVDGNLTFDSEEDERLQSLWASQQASGGSSGVSGDTLPIGSIIPYGNATPPTNWLVCDGSAVSRTTYAELFAVIGTSYGVGDGSTTFNLPNKKGKVSVGLDSSDTDFNTIGKTGGEKKHTLTIEEMPSHSHSINTYYESGGTKGIEAYESNTFSMERPTNNTGGNQPHNNLQPYEVDNWIIKAFQSAGVIAEVSNTESDSTTNTYSCNYVNNFVRGKTLYENTSGTNGNITLSETSANFECIEIFGHRTLGDYSTPFNEKIYNPNGKRVGLKSFIYHTDVVPLTIGIFTATINDTTITRLNASSYNMGSDGTISITSTNLTGMYITKVIGYKKGE